MLNIPKLSNFKKLMKPISLISRFANFKNTGLMLRATLRYST